MGVKALSRKLQKLQPALTGLVLETLNELESEIVKLNQEQLKQGERYDGSKTGTYQEKTKKRKKAEGRILTGDHISLIDTGDFWKSFFFEARNGKMLFGATDPKTEMLVSTWGEKILGLSPESYQKLADLIKPVLKNKILNFLAEA